MKKTIRQNKKQRGTMLVLIAAGAVALLGAGALAVDIGYFFTVRNQLQNAADAAAIAAAQGLIADPGNFSDSGSAKKWAIAIAAKNKAAGEPVVLSPGDITFPEGNIVQVRMNKSVPTFLGKVLGVAQVNLRVAAAAVPSQGVRGNSSGGGLRPWTVLDQFGHGGICVPPNDCDSAKPHGAFKDYPHTWNGVPVQTDYYKSPYDPEFDGMDLSRECDCGMVTGFIAPRDVNGQFIRLKDFKSCIGGENPWRTPGNYGAVALGSTGASVYRENITNGYNGLVRIGDILETETGNMNGPTISAVAALIAQDPAAYAVKNSAGKWVVMSPKYPMNESPRIVPIPMYSAYYPPGDGRTNFKVASIASFFVEGTSGRDVLGRFIHSRTKNSESSGEIPNTGDNSVGGGGRMLSTTRMVDVEE